MFKWLKKADDIIFDSKKILFTGTYSDFLGPRTLVYSKHGFLKANLLVRFLYLIFLLVMIPVSGILLLAAYYGFSKMGGRSFSDAVFFSLICSIAALLGLWYFLQALRGSLWAIFHFFAARLKS